MSYGSRAKWDFTGLELDWHRLWIKGFFQQVIDLMKRRMSSCSAMLFSRKGG